ncbi:hypothetical protein K435DRAFT_929890 [Dendrothele bispora CBS 962.96]|uniref:Uncharacterized protein n=1 Tax=Dendrothele bispora (strain CBS 962.96) TaxID=1314807 RepID=A0A4S8MF45_DENBC|nr:hypothetical protein K435DRAFT_929890 [Dendrothele bispora CBS 962.96]
MSPEYGPSVEDASAERDPPSVEDNEPTMLQAVYDGGANAEKNPPTSPEHGPSVEDANPERNLPSVEDNEPTMLVSGHYSSKWSMTGELTQRGTLRRPQSMDPSGGANAERNPPTSPEHGPSVEDANPERNLPSVEDNEPKMLQAVYDGGANAERNPPTSPEHGPSVEDANPERNPPSVEENEPTMSLFQQAVYDGELRQRETLRRPQSMGIRVPRPKKSVTT